MRSSAADATVRACPEHAMLLIRLLREQTEAAEAQRQKEEAAAAERQRLRASVKGALSRKVTTHLLLRTHSTSLRDGRRACTVKAFTNTMLSV